MRKKQIKLTEYEDELSLYERYFYLKRKAVDLIFEEFAVPSLLKKEIIDYCAMCMCWAAVCNYDIQENGARLDARKTSSNWLKFIELWFFLDHQINNLEQYIKVSAKKLRKYSGDAKKLIEKIQKTKSPTPMLKALVEIDPRWLYETWAQKVVEREIRTGNIHFLKTLGTAIADSKRKYFDKSRGQSKLIEYIKKDKMVKVIGFRSNTKKLPKGMPRNSGEYLNYLLKKGVINPDDKDIVPSASAFRKLLDRHNILPKFSISRLTNDLIFDTGGHK